MTSDAVTMAGTFTVWTETMAVTDVRHVGPQYERYEVQEPDPAWSQADPDGFEHRWLQRLDGQGDPVLPTAIRTERTEPCDGACGEPDHEWTIVEWHCRECGAEVTPGYRRGSRSTVVREGHFEVDAEWVPEGEFTLGGSAMRAATSRLVWPAGPGQMLDMTGEAWEQRAPEMTWVGSGGPPTVSQSFVFVPDGTSR